MSGTSPTAGADHVARPRALRVARWYAGFISRNRWWVILAVLAVTGIALIPVPDLLDHIVTNRAAIQNQDEPVRQRFDEIVRRFGTTFLATVVIEGRDRDAMHGVVDRLAATLTQAPPAGATPSDPCTDTRFSQRQVRSVFYKVDLSEFERRGIYYLSTGDLRKLGDALDAADAPATSAAVPPLTGLQAALDGIGDGLEKGTAQGTDDAKNAEMVRQLGAALDRILRWMDAPYPDERIADSAAPKLTQEDRRGADGAGYLSEGTDPIRMLMFVRPSSDSEDEDVCRCFTGLVRTAVGEAVRAGTAGGTASGGGAGIRDWSPACPRSSPTT